MRVTIGIISLFVKMVFLQDRGFDEMSGVTYDSATLFSFFLFFKKKEE